MMIHILIALIFLPNLYDFQVFFLNNFFFYRIDIVFLNLYFVLKEFERLRQNLRLFLLSNQLHQQRVLDCVQVDTR